MYTLQRYAMHVLFPFRKFLIVHRLVHFTVLNVQVFLLVLRFLLLHPSYVHICVPHV